ncbi:MAG TPA: serine hydrolase, partial [Kiritimatiellia bacterium]|nr:serine hydrolase [Kiritimatiellia bacterium]
MKPTRRLYALVGAVLTLLMFRHPAEAQRARIESRAADPYQGAILLAADGEVLFEDKADAPGYPASMVKMMNLLLILEGIDRGAWKLQDPIVITAESAGMGGSQVFLKEGEMFPIEELLYAMMIQSANDAAVALALKVAGTREGFVELMNRRAAELGMRSTRFHSVHGLPPAEGQEPDVSTPRDMARLCLALLRRPDALPFTSTIKRPFRPDAPEPFIMETHNRLLKTFEGCDG